MLKLTAAKRSQAVEMHNLSKNPILSLPHPGVDMAAVVGAICKILVSNISSDPSCNGPMRLRTKMSSYVGVASTTMEGCACRQLLKAMLQLRSRSLAWIVGKW
jgi:hypothetical protein